jgi:hypothetical protein
VPLNQTLTWQAASGTVTGYKVFIGTPNLPTEPTETVTDTTFTPTLAHGNVYQWRVVAYNATGDGDSSATWSFTTIPTPNPVFNVSPASHNFGLVNLGQTVTQTFTITNTGTANLIINSIVRGGTDQALFTLTAAGLPWTIAPGSNQAFTVAFRPMTPGLKTAEFTINHNAEGSSFIVNVSGTGPTPSQEPMINIMPMSHNFGNVDIGSSSSPQVFMVSNIGTADLVVSSIGWVSTMGCSVQCIVYSVRNGDGDSDATELGDDFVLTATGLPWIIAPGGNQTFTVVFSPTSEGSKSGMLRVMHNAAGSQMDVNVSGVGIMPLPGRVTLVSPAHNANEIVLRPTLTWLAPTTGGTIAGYYVYKCDMVNPPFDVDNPLVRRVAELGATATSWTVGADLEYETVYHWQVVAFNDTGKGEASYTWSFTTEKEVSEIDDVIGIAETRLLGNFPNPFNPSTTISFTVETPLMAFVLIEVYDIRGRLVRTLLDGSLEQGQALQLRLGAGRHSVVWDGRDDSGNQVSSGIYLYRMVAGEYQSIRRMILLK